MIYCIWYPSGGFGHFVNAVLTLHGKNFHQTTDTDAHPAKNGNFHNFKLAVPKYFHDPKKYQFEFDRYKNYSVLIDNGINNETESFRNTFPYSQTIKICYSDFSWPVVAKTMIIKAQQLDFEKEIQPDDINWKSNEDWTIREKYFLYLKDHYLRNQWKPNNDSNLMIEDMLDYQLFRQRLTQFGIEVDNFSLLWDSWAISNTEYTQPVIAAQNIIKSVKQDIPMDISGLSLWTQAVVNYYICLTYNYEIPANDFSAWFENTQQIKNLLKDKCES